MRGYVDSLISCLSRGAACECLQCYSSCIPGLRGVESEAQARQLMPHIAIFTTFPTLSPTHSTSYDSIFESILLSEV